MERQSVGEVVVVVVMVVMMEVAVGWSGLFLDPPPEMEEVVDGAGKPEGAVGVVAVDLVSPVEKADDERMIKIRNRDDESLGNAIFVGQTHLNSKPTFLHLHLLFYWQN